MVVVISLSSNRLETHIKRSPTQGFFFKKIRMKERENMCECVNKNNMDKMHFFLLSYLAHP